VLTVCFIVDISQGFNNWSEALTAALSR